MLGLFESQQERPVTPYERGPGDYVQEKYNKVVGTGIDFARGKSWSFFGSGLGKGILAAALITVAAAAIVTGIAAASGAIPIIGAFGFATTATASQGIMMGIGQGLSFLASGPGLALLGVGGLLGIAVESKRLPPGVSVDEAKALADKYKESREKGIEPEVTPQVATDKTLAPKNEAPQPEAKPAPVLVKDAPADAPKTEHASTAPIEKHDIAHSAAHDSKFHHVKDAPEQTHASKHAAPKEGFADKERSKDSTFVATEMQRRADAQSAVAQVG